MRVLVTRPSREATTSATRLAGAGHEALIAPVSRIEAVAAPTPCGPFQAALATSAHALAFLPRQFDACLPRWISFFCAGEKTYTAARRAGFENVAPPAADASALLATLKLDPAAGHLLYLAGWDRKPLLESDLSARGFAVEVAVVYRAAAEIRLPEAVIAALREGRLDAGLTFSRRSGAILIALAYKAGVLEELAALPQVCISQDAAAPFAELGTRVVVAETKDWEGMAAGIGRV